MIMIETLSFISILFGTYTIYIFLYNGSIENKKKQRVKALLSGERHDLDQEYTLRNTAQKYFKRASNLLINKYLSDKYKSSVLNDLYLAGQRSNTALLDFYMKSLAMATIAASAPLILGLDPLLSPVAGLIAFMLPKLELDSIKKKRQRDIRRSFPLALDMIVICLEAGYNLEKSMTVVINNIEKISGKGNHVSEEFKILQNELQLGLDSIDAWNNLYKRTQIDEIKQFTTSVLQSERIGSTLASTLRNLSLFLIKQKAQDLESMAASLGAKITLPLAVCILPVILGFVAGPFVVEILSSKLF